MTLKLLEEEGLIDVKVSLDPDPNASVEDIFEQMGRIIEAHKAGETTPYYDF